MTLGGRGLTIALNGRLPCEPPKNDAGRREAFDEGREGRMEGSRMVEGEGGSPPTVASGVAGVSLMRLLLRFAAVENADGG